MMESLRKSKIKHNGQSRPLSIEKNRSFGILPKSLIMKRNGLLILSINIK